VVVGFEDFEDGKKKMVAAGCLVLRGRQKLELAINTAGYVSCAALTCASPANLRNMDIMQGTQFQASNLHLSTPLC